MRKLICYKKYFSHLKIENSSTKTEIVMLWGKDVVEGDIKCRTKSKKPSSIFSIPACIKDTTML